MKKGALSELKNLLLLFLWLLLTQTASGLVAVIVMLVLKIVAYGGILWLAPTPSWVWMTGGVLICLFWLLMGWVTSHEARPGPAGTVIVLALWTALTVLMSSALWSIGIDFWDNELWTLILGPAMFGFGLRLGWKTVDLYR